MLINNRIYRELYNFGYKGRQNPYEFWKKKKDDVLEYLRFGNPTLIDDKYQLDAFEAKVRWRSPIGTLLAFEIQKRLSKYTINTISDISEIRVKYGEKMYSIDDFNRLHPLSNTDSRVKTDIRGISIIHTDIESFNFKEVDFRYASINSCICKNVEFQACRMDYMTLNRSEFRECYFDNRCSMYSVDFSDSLLKSDFRCPIEEPIISYLENKDARRILLGFDQRWRAFTEIEGSTFIQNCNNIRVNRYIIRKQNKIEELYNIKNGSVLPRVMSVFKHV